MEFISTHDNTWHRQSGEDGAVPHPLPQAHALLTLEQWHAVRAQWPADLPTGLLLDNSADIHALVDDLPRLALVVLQFPKWTDGRAYSQARLLRGRYRYRGDVRAIGEVLVDMLPLLQRTGFASVQLRADQSTEHAHQALRFFAAHYQGDTRERLPLFNREAA
jgi:uncharacterized protein (DUF934 family)